MILAILNSIFAGVEKIFLKKSTELSKFSTYGFKIIGSILALIIALFLYFYGENKIDNYDSIILLTISITTIIVLIIHPLNQTLVKEEKISSLIPFNNLHRIFVIIISFFIFKDVSFISLLICLFSIILISFFSIDIKKFHLPKKIKKIIIVQSFLSIKILLTGFILIYINQIEYFLIYSIITLILLFLLLFKGGIYKNDISIISSHNKTFWFYRMGTSAISYTSFIVSLYLIKNLGISITVLLSFFTVISSLIFSYLFFNDIPTKKNLSLAFIITFLVGMGYIFR